MKQLSRYRILSASSGHPYTTFPNGSDCPNSTFVVSPGVSGMRRSDPKYLNISSSTRSQFPFNLRIIIPFCLLMWNKWLLFSWVINTHMHPLNHWDRKTYLAELGCTPHLDSQVLPEYTQCLMAPFTTMIILVPISWGRTSKKN